MRKEITLIVVFLLGDSFISSIKAEEDLLGTFSDLADDLVELFNEEKCTFTCPNGEKPVPREGHVPKSNGCGSYGIKIDLDWLPIMGKCCDKHDYCYDTCGTVKETCDRNFKRCLNKACDEMKNNQIIDAKTLKKCKNTASMFYGGTAVLGCPAFEESQEKACYCSRSEAKKRKPKTEL